MTDRSVTRPQRKIKDTSAHHHDSIFPLLPLIKHIGTERCLCKQTRNKKRTVSPTPILQHHNFCCDIWEVFTFTSKWWRPKGPQSALKYCLMRGGFLHRKKHNGGATARSGLDWIGDVDMNLGLNIPVIHQRYSNTQYSVQYCLHKNLHVHSIAPKYFRQFS